MLPACRRTSSKCDWFAYLPETSRAYVGKPGTRLLVFLVLPVKRAVFSRFCNDLVLTMRCATYQLPIGTVELIQTPMRRENYRRGWAAISRGWTVNDSVSMRERTIGANE